MGDTVVRVVYRPGFPASAAPARRRRPRSRSSRRGSGPYPYRVLKVVQSAGGYGMEGPGVAWIPTGVGSSNLALPRHPRDRPPVVLRDRRATTRRASRSPTRRPRTSSPATCWACGALAGARAAPLDRSIYRYSRACYYETIYIQGGNLLDDARKRMGSTAFWAALRGYIADHRWGLVHTRTLLDALDAGDAARPAPRGGVPRFPTLY